MATKTPEQVQVTVCDRCGAVLVRTFTRDAEGAKGNKKVGAHVIRTEVLRKKFGPVSFALGGHELFGYDEICERCMEVIQRIVKKCRPVKRGGHRTKKGPVGQKKMRTKSKARK